MKITMESVQRLIRIAKAVERLGDGVGDLDHEYIQETLDGIGEANSTALN